jgi:hypothetical protein
VSVRRLLLALLVAVVVPTLGCAAIDPGPDLSVELTEADVMGTWRNDQFDGSITFAADGTFRATNVPYEFFFPYDASPPPTFDPKHDRVDDTGTWTLTGPDPEHPERRRVIVRAHFQDVPALTNHGRGADMGAERLPDGATGLVLLIYSAHPRFENGRYIYRKVGGTPTPAPS